MVQISKKHKFIRDGVFYTELREFLKRELAEDGFTSVEHRINSLNTDIIIHATKPREIMGENHRRISEITSMIQKRFKYREGKLRVYVERVYAKGLSAMAQVESLRYKLISALPVRRAAMSILRFCINSGAKGVDVLVSGKIRGQRAKCMKFREGYMIRSGSTQEFVDVAQRHVLLRAGCIGIKVKIMLPYDPKGEQGPAKLLPDMVIVNKHKD